MTPKISEEAAPQPLDQYPGRGKFDFGSLIVETTTFVLGVRLSRRTRGQTPPTYTHLCDVQAARLDAHVRHVLPHRGALDQPNRGVRLVHVPDRQVQREIQQRRRRLFVNLPRGNQIRVVRCWKRRRREDNTMPGSSVLKKDATEEKAENRGWGGFPAAAARTSDCFNTRFCTGDDFWLPGAGNENRLRLGIFTCSKGSTAVHVRTHLREGVLITPNRTRRD